MDSLLGEQDIHKILRKKVCCAKEGLEEDFRRYGLDVKVTILLAYPEQLEKWGGRQERPREEIKK